MSEFLRNCIEYRERFELCPPKDVISIKAPVIIKKGPYQGYEATVANARYSKGRLTLGLSITMVSGQIDIELKDVDAGDVCPINPADASALRNDFIRYTQNNVLEILTRRALFLEKSEREHRRQTKNNAQQAMEGRLTQQDRQELKPFLEDSEMLERLLSYRDYEITSPSANAHFKALMLICAHLCRDEQVAGHLTDIVLHLLKVDEQTGDFTIRSDTDAYLCIALKVATNNPNYRDKVKDYMRTRQPKSQKLHDFVALIRKNVKY